MAVQEDELRVKSVSGADCALQCTAKYKPEVQYTAVRWYKVTRRAHFMCFHAGFRLNMFKSARTETRLYM